MDKPFYELSNAEFLPWLINLINIINKNKTSLPITADKITALEARRDSHETKLNAQIAADEAAKSATRDINDDRELSNADVSFINTIFKADKSIPRELIIEMGLRPDAERTSPPPNDPTNLIVMPNAAGYTDLKWSRNGNKQTTLYDIEAQYDGNPEWVHVETVQTLKYRHENQTVGKQVVYRVRARRAGQASAFSSAGVAYYKG
ncbi:MAG TPA: fibronectin type III domain-containing protein [Pyrinomonadaceae bacterium]|nr:fibronectin type III domain-containing protein [Pyrinomonadaceae bacterium]